MLRVSATPCVSVAPVVKFICKLDDAPNDKLMVEEVSAVKVTLPKHCVLLLPLPPPKMFNVPPPKFS